MRLQSACTHANRRILAANSSGDPPDLFGLRRGLRKNFAGVPPCERGGVGTRLAVVPATEYHSTPRGFRRRFVLVLRRWTRECRYALHTYTLRAIRRLRATTVRDVFAYVHRGVSQNRASKNWLASVPRHGYFPRLAWSLSPRCSRGFCRVTDRFPVFTCIHL